MENKEDLKIEQNQNSKYVNLQATLDINDFAEIFSKTLQTTCCSASTEIQEEDELGF